MAAQAGDRIIRLYEANKPFAAPTHLLCLCSTSPCTSLLFPLWRDSATMPWSLLGNKRCVGSRYPQLEGQGMDRIQPVT